MKCYQVDAFTNVPFSGNPAVVVLLDEKKDDVWMQSVAREMNVSETAFILSQGHQYSLRWFTPTTEVDLCGHATLASAHILFSNDDLDANASELQFATNRGMLLANRSGAWIELNFPAEIEQTVTDPPADLLHGLGSSVQYVGKNRLDYILELESEETLREIKPNWTKLAQIDARGVIVTARSEDAQYDFVSRAFYPNIGINEDPVTGSAHCCLGPYWRHKLGKQELIGYQASQRGGVVQVRVPNGGDRVVLRGQAVTILAGDLL